MLSKIHTPKHLCLELLAFLELHHPLPVGHILQKRSRVDPVKLILDILPLNSLALSELSLKQNLIVIVLGIHESSMTMVLSILDVSLIEVPVFGDHVPLSVLLIRPDLPGSKVDALMSLVSFNGQILEDDILELLVCELELLKLSPIFNNLLGNILLEQTLIGLISLIPPHQIPRLKLSLHNHLLDR